MDIQIGDYVRTKQGYIGKYSKSVDGYDEFTDSEGTFYFDVEHAKHSKNIIDLIEEGDYVNGMLVIEVIEAGELDNEVKALRIEGTDIMLINEEIERVVTHQSFKQVECEVS